jgi:endonuclease YncB( thermonuclease family)
LTAPRHCPPYGFCVPVTPSKARDGDTVVVHVQHLALEWAVRLIACWCPELHRGSKESQAIGKRAKAFAQDVLDKADEGDLRWFVPFSSIDGENINILKFLSFDRVPGYLYVGPTQTLNRMLVDAGLASTTKGGELGK